MTLSFLVKHDAKKRKPLVDRKPSYRTAPTSYTSRAPTSKIASRGNNIYVVEIRKLGRITTYWLGYRFLSIGSALHPPSGKWEGKFSYKNFSTPPVPAKGMYFDEPVLITDHDLNAWLLEQQGMIQIPDKHVPVLDAMLSAFGAKPCS